MSSGFAKLLLDTAVTGVRIMQELNKNTPVEEICTKYDVPPETVEAIRNAINNPID